jgi:hypothetical protein
VVFARRERNMELWVRSWNSEYIRAMNTVATRPKPIAASGPGSTIAARTQTAR